MKGAPIHYSDAELAFVQVHCAMKRGALHTAFVREFGRTDVTADNIKQLCTRNGWTTGRVMAWRAEDDALLREIYHYRPTTEVAQRLGRSLISTYARAKYLGLKKSKAYLASSESGRLRPGERRSPATQFTKGHAPWTKGKKMPFNANSAATQFKKGSLGGRAAAVVKPIGFERIHKSGYLTRKIHNGRPMHSRGASCI